MKVSQAEYQNRRLEYKEAYNDLMTCHLKRPSVVETCIYMLLIGGENPKEIIEFMEEIERQKMKIEYLYNPQKDETTVYVWRGTRLKDATTYKGEMTKDEKTKMTKEIRDESNKR